MATRACGRPLSKAAITCVGFSSAISFVSIWVKPYAALIGTPRVVFSTGSAKNARYTRPYVSSSMSFASLSGALIER